MTSKTKQDQFNEEMFADIAAAKSRAEIFPETQVVHLSPQWNDEITKESFQKHMDFANRQMLILGGVVSEVAHEQYPDTKALTWTGNMHLGEAAELHTKHYLREDYHVEGAEETSSNFGITDMAFTYNLSAEQIQFYDHFTAIDNERCQKLFEDDNKTA